MNLEFAKRARKITSLVVVSSIIGLSLLSFLPLISETESDLEDGTVSLNIEMMKKSDNEQIKGLTEKLQLISICFWLVIIFGLLSFVGIIIYVSGKFSPLAQIIMLIGCTSIVFSVLVVFLHWDMIKNIGNMEGISLSFIIGYIPISYVYLPLIMGVISLIGSVLYITVVTPSPIKHIITIVKQKKPAKKQNDQKEMQRRPTMEKEQPPLEETPSEVVTDKTRTEKEQWSKEQMQPLEKPAVPKETISVEPSADKEDHLTVEHEQSPEQGIPLTPRHPPNQEKSSDMVEKTRGKPATDEQTSKPEISSETLQEQSQESEEPLTSPSFKQALSSAIEKRKPEIDEDKTDKEQQSTTKKISIRCPECRNIFSVKVGEDLTKIECPKCGKKEIAK